MGYYTQFEGSIIGPVDSAVEYRVANAIADEFWFDDPDFYYVDQVFSACGEMKWYDWREDMEKISLQFPTVTIYLHGEGEDSEDMWNAYFKNGKSVVYHAQITYPEFNPKDLE